MLFQDAGNSEKKMIYGKRGRASNFLPPHVGMREIRRLRSNELLFCKMWGNS